MIRNKHARLEESPPRSTHPTPGSRRRWLVAALILDRGEMIIQHLARGRSLTVLAGLLDVDRRTATEAARRLGYRNGWAHNGNREMGA